MAQEAGRIEWLDGLRAYAIAGVVLVHSSQLLDDAGGVLAPIAALGQYGVQLFFIVSAITVFQTLNRAAESGAPVWHWWLRRYLRIAPLYYCAILFYGAVMYGKLRFVGGEALPFATWLQYAGLNFVFLHAFFEGANNAVVPGGWSIGVEMVFYAFAPLLLTWLRSSKYPVTILVVLIVGCLAITFASTPQVNTNDYFYFWPFTQLPVIFCGLVLCVLTKDWLLSDAPAPKGWVFGAAGVFVAAGFVGAQFGVINHVSQGLAPIAFGASFCGLVILARGPLVRLFDNRLAIQIGVASYSIYIVHFAILKAVRNVDDRLLFLDRMPSEIALVVLACAALAGSYGLALVTQRLIERPARSFARKLASA